MAQFVREAALKPIAAESYPYLPARMWTAAGRLAELVAKYRGIPAEAVNRLNRVLSDQDFGSAGRARDDSGSRLRKGRAHMMISVSRTKAGAGLTLQTRRGNGNTVDDFEETIHPGESGLGFTYEEWDAAVGPHDRRRIEVTEEGFMRPVPDEARRPQG